MKRNFTELDARLMQERIDEKRGRAPKKVPEPKPSKFKNHKVETEEGKFDSKKEYQHYQNLKAQLMFGNIDQIKRQVNYDLHVNGQKVCRYIADFVVTYKSGDEQVQDVKSDFTRKNPVYRLKKKLMAAVHGIEIVEV